MKIYFLFFILLVYAFPSVSQVNNSGNIFFKGTATIFSDFTNNNQVAYDTNAVINFLGGNYINSPNSLTQGVGGPIFSRTIIQGSTGGSFAASLGSLSVNNPDNVQILGSTILRNNLVFQVGRIDASKIDTTVYIGFSTAQANVIGANNNRHVNGYVAYFGGSDFLFPIGDGSVLRPVGINTSSGIYKAAYFPNNPRSYAGPSQIGTLNNNLGADIDSIVPVGFWDVDGNVPANLTFYFNDLSASVPNLSSLIVVGYDANSGEWQNVGRGEPVGDLVNGGSLTLIDPIVPNSFSAYAFGSGIPQPLPIVLGDFKVDLNEVCARNITWETNSEMNISGFELEAKKGDEEFQQIAFIPAKGKHEMQTYYHFLDESYANQKTILYRLKVINLENQVELVSKIILAQPNCATIPDGDWKIFPNPLPIGNSLSLAFENSDQNAKIIAVFDSKGKQLFSKNISTNEQTELELPQLNAGIYFIKVISVSNQITSTKKLIVY